MAFATKAALRSISASRALAKKESDTTVAQYAGDGNVPLLPAAEEEGQGGEERATAAAAAAALDDADDANGSRTSPSPSPPSPSARGKKERKKSVRGSKGKEGGAKDPLSELISFLPLHRRSGALSFLRHLAADSRIHLRKNWIYEGEDKKGHIIAVLAAQFLPASSPESRAFFHKYKAKSEGKKSSVTATLNKTLRIATGSGRAAAY